MKPVFRRSLAALLCALTLNQLIPPASARERSDSIFITEDVFPDTVFRQWLTDPANLNGAGADTMLTQEELAEIRSINVSSLGISSLEGIEVFYALEELSCKNNTLTELNVQQNSALRYLQCDQNRISSLDVSGLTQLKSLYCEHNHMTALDLTGCTALETIYCRNNDLTSLDFSTNRNLKFIETFDNLLTKIDLSMLSELEFVHLDHNRLTHLDLSHNPKLTGDGSGFVAKNNYLQTLILPDRPDQVVNWEVYLEQEPQPGYERMEWYYDPQYTLPVQEVTPADGRTLYAKWTPITYTIFFDPGSGSGRMESVTHTYDQEKALPQCMLTPPAGLEFVGWARMAGGPVAFRDEVPVRNLASNQDDNVILHAVWGTPILNQYMDRLDAIYGRYDASDYTAQDWKVLEDLYEETMQALLTAGNAEAMAGIFNRAQADMSAVPDVSFRTQSVLAVWHQDNQQVLQLTDHGAVTESNARQLLTAARSAGEALSANFVAGCTDLTLPADQTLVAEQARSAAHSQLAGLDRLADAAAWAAELNGLSLSPMEEVTSQTVSDYQTAITAADTHTSQLHPDLLEGLRTRAALALYKQQSVQALCTAYQDYDPAQYSEEGQAQPNAIWQKATAAMETAASETGVTALLNTALEELRAVPTKTPDSQPGGDSDTGSSGETGGSSNGSSGGGSVQEPAGPPEDAGQQPAWENPYADISQDAWYYASLAYVTSNGIINGYTDGTFRPHRTLSRAQLAQLLYNLEGRPGTDVARYTDTEAGAWYESAVGWAAGAGILTGYADGSIRPNAPVTRQQLAAVLYRYARHTGRDVTLRADLNSYCDADQISPYALEALQWTNAAGIIHGSGDALLPGSPTTRAQTAVILTRFCTGEPPKSR